MDNLGSLNKILRAPQAFETRKEKLLECIEEFLVENIDPSSSSNLNNGVVDDMSAVFEVLGSEIFRRSELLTPLLKVIKVLMRKPINRQALQDPQVAALLPLLQSPPNVIAARETANVVLNMCYDSQNVSMFVELGGVGALLPLTQSNDSYLQGSALGAIQSVSYQHQGRRAIREIGAVPAICSLLNSMDDKVKARAVGAVHNLSADASNIRYIREAGGLSLLVSLLRSHQVDICSLAAGALQNISREQASRKVLFQSGAVIPLTDLLVCSDVNSQASAAGALLNILGPELDDSKKEVFRIILADSIVMGSLMACLSS